MKPVDKLIVHDPENGLFGDCLRACVASILELSAEEVPHFYRNGFGDENHLKAQAELDEFLARYGLVQMCFPWDGLMEKNGATTRKIIENSWSIIGGKNAQGVDHAVVGCGLTPVHDPNPNRAGLSVFEDVTIFVAKDPSRMARVAALEKAIRENGKCARPSCCGGKTYTRIGLGRIKTDVCSRCSGTNLEPWAREALEEKL